MIQRPERSELRKTLLALFWAVFFTAVGALVNFLLSVSLATPQMIPAVAVCMVVLLLTNYHVFLSTYRQTMGFAPFFLAVVSVLVMLTPVAAHFGLFQYL